MNDNIQDEKHFITVDVRQLDPPTANGDKWEAKVTKVYDRQIDSQIKIPQELLYLHNGKTKNEAIDKTKSMVLDWMQTNNQV